MERAIRPIALGRKNHLFAGSDGGADRWAIVCSLITTAKLNDREPYAYLKDVLDRMTNGHPGNQLDDLLPWNWTPAAGPVPVMDAYFPSATDCQRLERLASLGSNVVCGWSS